MCRLITCALMGLSSQLTFCCGGVTYYNYGWHSLWYVTTTTIWRLNLTPVWNAIPSVILKTKGPETEILVPTWQNYSCTFICQVGRFHTSHWCQLYFYWLCFFLFYPNIRKTQSTRSCFFYHFTPAFPSLGNNWKLQRNHGLTIQYHNWTLHEEYNND